MTADRRTFLGGSDAGAILGVSPWRSAYQVWQAKTAPQPEPADPERERFFARGKRLEPVVLDMLRDETGIAVAERNVRVIDREHDFLACEIDAVAAGGENIEVKTVHPMRAREWGDEGSDEIPLVYAAQVHHGLMITGRAVCIVAALIGADDLRVYRVERDDDLIAAMRAREVEFWQRYVVPCVPPPLATAADVELRWPRDSGTAIEASDDVARAVAELHALKEEAKQIGQRIAETEAAVKTAMGDAAVLTYGDRKLATWKTQARTVFDQRAFAAAHGDLFQQFRRATESRKFQLA